MNWDVCPVFLFSGRVYIDKKDITVFIKKIIDNKYEIFEFKLETITLEDAFLKKAGGNKID